MAVWSEWAEPWSDAPGGKQNHWGIRRMKLVLMKVQRSSVWNQIRIGAWMLLQLVVSSGG